MMRIKDKVNVKRADIVLLIGIVAISANLRPAITSVGPLIGFIRDDMHLSNGLAGLLTTLPLVAFAVFSPLAPKFSRRLGIEMTLFLGLMTLVAGIMLRSTPSMSTLYIGTFTLGMAIAVSNVLLPSLIKQKFSGQSRSHDRRIHDVYGRFCSAWIRCECSPCVEFRPRVAKRARLLGRFSGFCRTCLAPSTPPSKPIGYFAKDRREARGALALSSRVASDLLHGITVVYFLCHRDVDSQSPSR